MKQKILIAEPSSIVCAGLTATIGKNFDFKVISDDDDFIHIEQRATAYRPNIVIINPSIFAHGQVSQLSNLFHGFPLSAIIALVYQHFDASVLKHFDTTIDINDSQQTVITTIGEALRQRSNKVKEHNGNSELTQRETEVLVLVAQGMASKEIAEQLNISVHTVVTHRKNITHKTGIKSVAGLAVYAMLNNLLDSPATE